MTNENLFQNIIHRTIALRHDLHRLPELKWQEAQTSKTISSVLDRLKVPWRTCAETGIVAQIGGGDGGSIAFRADMDGLKLTENSSVPWSSENVGCMHGCGHDGHMAVLLGVAEYLQCCRERLPQPVTLIFQPAEEGGFGARKMIDDGALDGVEKIFGWHNWPAIPRGRVVCCPGVVMAANGVFSIQLHGRGGHASEPEACVDPMVGAAAIILGLQQIVARNLAPQRAAVISVTTICANGAETIIPDKVELTGSVRVERGSDLDWVSGRMREVITNIAAGYGLRSKFTLEPRYPALVNHEEEAGQAAEVLADVFGADWGASDVKLPVMASEDFSYYIKRIPGAFMLVGAADAGKETFPLHNSCFDFNDKLVEPMLKVMIGLAGVDMV